MTKIIKQITADCSGATAVEYGLIVSLIVIAIVTSLNTFGNSTQEMWSTVSTTYQEQSSKVR